MTKRGGLEEQMATYVGRSNEKVPKRDVRLRIDGSTLDLTEEAAAVLDKTRAEFMIEAIRREALNVLRERQLFAIDPKQYEALLARFEELGLPSDRALIRSLARRLAENEPEPARLPTTAAHSIAGEPPQVGGILAALRRSPMVGAELDLSRPFEEGRKIDL